MRMSKTRRKMSLLASEMSKTRRKMAPLADELTKTRRKMTLLTDKLPKIHRKITFLTATSAKTRRKIAVLELRSHHPESRAQPRPQIPRLQTLGASQDLRAPGKQALFIRLYLRK